MTDCFIGFDDAAASTPGIQSLKTASKSFNTCQGREHVRGLASTEFRVHVEKRIGNVCLVTL